jgi:hypothetical protein
MIVGMTARWVLAMAGLSVGASIAIAQDVTRPGDVLVPSSTNFPAAENPPSAIDNSANTKYLNFDITNTGFTVTPSGTGVVHAITLITANDAPNRDPASFSLEGSNDGTTFTLIAQGPLSPPTTRFSFYQARFANTTSYSQYRVLFPTVSNSVTANSMQVSEVQLNTDGNILTSGDGITATYTSGASAIVGQGPAGMIDGQLGTAASPKKFAVTNGNSGPTTVDITPAVGASIITGIDLFSDEVGNPGTTPGSVTLSGSNNGVTYTQIFTTALTPSPAIYGDQQYTFANTTAYTRYRLAFGASTDATMSIAELQLIGNALGAAPGNDDCANAQTISNGTISASNINGTGADVTTCGTSDANDVWFRYTATATGTVEINTCGAGTLDTTVGVFASCGGAQLGCNDNACAGKSRVRFAATTGVSYLVRVAGVGGATGSFTLNVVPSPVIHNDVIVPLAYNFNGMVHTGEANDPDNLNGYRSLSDRGMLITGTPGSLDVGVEGVSGIPYSVVTQPFVLDTVQLGNRNTCDNGTHAFDATADGDDIGVQPAWLADPNQTGPQTTNLLPLNLTMGANSKVGFIGNASNGGTSFIAVLNFADASSVSVFVDYPDWFGVQTVGPAEAGVESQSSLGVFFGASLEDVGAPDVALNVVEAVISNASLVAAGLGDQTGKQLASITFMSSLSATADTGIYAMTIRDAAGGSPAGVCCRGATCNTTITSAGACTGSGTAGAAFSATGSTCNSGPVSSSPCCYANYNKANGITVQDIFDFLTDWFAGNNFAKTGGDGATGGLTVQNIFDFLSDWFAGGCS